MKQLTVLQKTMSVVTITKAFVFIAFLKLHCLLQATTTISLAKRLLVTSIFILAIQWYRARTDRTRTTAIVQK